MAGVDRVEYVIESFAADCLLGILPSERVLPQRVLVDLVVGVNIAHVAGLDNSAGIHCEARRAVDDSGANIAGKEGIHDSTLVGGIDYRDFLAVLEQVASRPIGLQETLAQLVLSGVMAIEGVIDVSVHVRKVAIYAGAASVGLRLSGHK